jgi:hypothetical protein
MQGREAQLGVVSGLIALAMIMALSAMAFSVLQTREFGVSAPSAEVAISQVAHQNPPAP